MIVLIALVCAAATGIGYYTISKWRINKRIQKLKSTGLDAQLELFKKHMDRAQDEINAVKKNPFVEAQKKKHEEFRASQSDKDSDT